MRKTNIKPVVPVLVLLFSLLQVSCRKYLEAKPDKTLAIPQSVKELQGLLNLETNNNAFPIGGLFSDDNVYSPFANWNSIFAVEDRQAYIWDANNDFTRDYGAGYSRLFYANVVLDYIDKVNDRVSTPEEYRNVKGSGYFHRAINFYELAQVFAPPYSPASAATNFGIPLKLTPNIEDETVRSTVEGTYARIIADAKESLKYLPATPGSVASLKMRPGKAAAYGLLARTWLVMGNYANALLYADSCLMIHNILLNYNASPVSVAATNPFPRFNDEVIFHVTARNATSLTSIRIDTNVYKSYDANDLRKTAFFRSNGDGTYNFKGNYNAAGNRSLFSGIATDEIYLIKAECLARAGQTTAAMDVLNALLIKRWQTGLFVPFTAATADEALVIILRERRKELCFRPSLEWTDLRRLNLDNRFAKTVSRVLNGQTYQLLPNDLKYTFLIPFSVINMSGIEQNAR
jgi:hypothetical protein